MFRNFIQNLFGSAPAQAPVRKTGALHPGVAASRARGRATAVGVVYDRDGAPKIAPDFLANLPGHHRTWVYNDLLKHGYQLHPDSTVTKIEET
jgi:hypothetical protein